MTDDEPRTALATAERFLQAVVWGEHLVVWELLSPSGRDHVLEAGARRGLDAVQAARLRQGTSPQAELDTFLTGLTHGLRVDFSSVELDKIRVRESDEPSEKPRAASAGEPVELLLECPAAFGSEWWSAGSIILSGEPWLVDRVKPLVSRAE